MTTQKDISFEELMNNKELRDEAIRAIRRNSIFTLKQIGELFGGISESRISKIIGK